MAAVSDQLIWEIVKKNNSFLVKEFGRGNASVQFSKESNNLYNLNSYKHSGLANRKTVTIQPSGKDLSVILATTKTKKQNKPASLLHKSVMRKEFPRMAKAVANQANKARRKFWKLILVESQEATKRIVVESHFLWNHNKH